MSGKMKLAIFYSNHSSKLSLLVAVLQYKYQYFDFVGLFVKLPNVVFLTTLLVLPGASLLVADDVSADDTRVSTNTDKDSLTNTLEEIEQANSLLQNLKRLQNADSIDAAQLAACEQEIKNFYQKFAESHDILDCEEFRVFARAYAQFIVRECKKCLVSANTQVAEEN
jgi:hypothetical protein